MAEATVFIRSTPEQAKEMRPEALTDAAMAGLRNVWQDTYGDCQVNGFLPNA